MEKFLVMVSGIGPVEYGHYHEALGCQKDYWAAGHTADIYIHNGSVPALAKRTEDFDGFDVNANNVVPIPAPDKKESDPHGTNPHAPGAKLDAGKNRLGLVLGSFADALWEVGKVGTYGANKYTDDGWRSVPGARGRYMDALYRHLLRAQSGELFDPDTQLLHLAHVAWNALALLHFEVGDDEIPF